MKHTRHGISILLLAVFLTSTLRAEGDAFLTSDRPVDDETLIDKGREGKYEGADASGKAGQAVAAMTGAAMIATGTPMLSSPISAVVAAGVTLVTMGGIELAQAAADGNTNAKNIGGRDKIVENGYTVNGVNANPANNMQLPPELENFLGGRGINSDAFRNDLINGGLTDRDTVMRAMGMDPADFTVEDLQKGQSMAESQAMDMIQNRDQAAGLVAVEGGEGGAGGTLAGGFAGASEMGELSNGTLGAPGSVNPLAQLLHQTGAGRGPASTSGAETSSSGFDPASMFSKLTGQPLAKTEAGKADQASQFIQLMPQLKEKGISRPLRPFHIFQVAAKNFHSFGKWRKTLPKPTKLSKNTVASNR